MKKASEMDNHRTKCFHSSTVGQLLESTDSRTRDISNRKSLEKVVRKNKQHLNYKEMSQKIHELEQDLKILINERYPNNYSYEKGHLSVKNLDLHDVVSSQATTFRSTSKRNNIYSNNQKSLQTGTFRKVGNTFQKSIRTEDSYQIVHQKLNETKEIISRGLLTTRRLNEEIDRIKQNRISRGTHNLPVTRDTHIDSFAPPISHKIHDLTRNEEYLIAEQLTSLLLQNDRNHRATTDNNQKFNQRRYLNIGHVKLTEETLQSKNRLTVQKIPGHVIKDSLCVQPLPQINILSQPPPKPNNVKVVSIEYPLINRDSSSNRQKLNDRTPDVHDISVQVEMSEKSISESKRISPPLPQHWYHNDRIIELVNKVRSSREIVQQMHTIRRTEDLTSSYSDDQNKNHLASDRKVENYESDFEMDSVPIDDICDTTNNQLLFLNSPEPGNLLSIQQQQLNVRSSSCSDKHECVLEEQMKRLGLSPQRTSLGKSKRHRDGSMVSRDEYVFIGGDSPPDNKVLENNVSYQPVSLSRREPEVIEKKVIEVESVDGRKNQIALTEDTSYRLGAPSVLERINHSFEKTKQLLDRISKTSNTDEGHLQILRKRYT